MKLIKTQEAVGHVLCHDMTQIIRGEFKGPRFRKGHVVTEEDIPVLLDVGKEHLYVWEKKEGTLHEDEAAGILREICMGNDPSMTASEPDIVLQPTNLIPSGAEGDSTQYGTVRYVQSDS